jgi:hypothetical protein
MLVETVAQARASNTHARVAAQLLPRCLSAQCGRAATREAPRLLHRRPPIQVPSVRLGTRGRNQKGFRLPEAASVSPPLGPRGGCPDWPAAEWQQDPSRPVLPRAFPNHRHRRARIPVSSLAFREDGWWTGTRHHAEWREGRPGSEPPWHAACPSDKAAHAPIATARPRCAYSRAWRECPR